MPANAGFQSPGTTIERGLVHGTSPMLLALDKEFATTPRELVQLDDTERPGCIPNRGNPAHHGSAAHPEGIP